MSLASKLKECRLKKGKSLQEVADAIGVSKAHFWELESGKSKNPSFDLLRKISDYFNISIGWLMDEDVNSSENQDMKVLFRQLQGLNDEDLDMIKMIVESKLRKKDV